MRGLRTTAPCLAALLLGATLSGCPGDTPGAASAPGAGALSLAYDGADQGKQPQVGERLQLRLQFAGETGQYMMGALINEPPERVTTWHADPADAVRFDPDTSKAEFLRAGSVRIWATYVQDGQEMRSNEVTLSVAAPSQPADEAAPPEPAPVPAPAAGSSAD